MSNLPPIKSMLEAHGLWANKKFGQHFLLDQQLLGTIASYAGELSGTHVVEVGPGPGGLTRAMLARGARVTAIEKDERFRPLLEPLQQAYPGQLDVIYGDALKVDLTKLATMGTRSEPALSAQSAVSYESQKTFTETNIKVVANLPYNVGTQLLTNWLTQIAQMGPDTFERLTLMFQKEVAGRVVAEPNSKAYGRLSVISQFLCHTELHRHLPPGAFSPPPKVASSVISLVPKQMLPAYVKFADLEKVVACAFNQRRKMLRQALKPLGHAEALLEKAGIDGTRRAENLSVEEFCDLASSFCSS